MDHLLPAISAIYLCGIIQLPVHRGQRRYKKLYCSIRQTARFLTAHKPVQKALGVPSRFIDCGIICKLLRRLLTTPVEGESKI